MAVSAINLSKEKEGGMKVANKSNQTTHQLHQANQIAKREASNWKWEHRKLQDKLSKIKQYAEGKLSNQEAILPEDLIELLEA